MAIRIQLACVHIDNDGTQTMEVMFVDEESGFCGHKLLVYPHGVLKVVGAFDDQEAEPTLQTWVAPST